MIFQNSSFPFEQPVFWIWSKPITKIRSDCLWTTGPRRYQNYAPFPSGSPKPPIVSTNPAYNIFEGDQLNLTCHSHVKPPANYSWFKRNQTLHHYQPKLIIQSVHMSDSGEYSCRVENQLGESTNHVLIEVKRENLNCVELLRETETMTNVFKPS